LDFTKIETVGNFDFNLKDIPDEVVLINNSGTLSEVKHVGNLSNSNIIDGYNVNMVAPAILMNNFVKTFEISSAKKTILNISSGAGKNAYDGWGVYCSSKAAIDMFSRVLAEEQRIDGSAFSVFSVAPGVVNTEMQQVIRNSEEKDFSNLKVFLKYNNDQLLTEPEFVAKKLFYILQNTKNFNEVLLSVRDF
jgi:benzil reductase ((S)-benzoin forming)